MTVRDATPRDIDALLELERACYPPNQAYSREEYRYALTRAKAVNLVLEEPSEALVGFVGAFYHRTHRLGHVYTVNVDPRARGRGLGRALMEACHERLRALDMRRVVLEVNVENEAAMRLYEAVGYVRARRLKGYYTQYRVNDAWQYVRDL